MSISLKQERDITNHPADMLKPDGKLPWQRPRKKDSQPVRYASREELVPFQIQPLPPISNLPIPQLLLNAWPLLKQGPDALEMQLAVVAIVGSMMIRSLWKLKISINLKSICAIEIREFLLKKSIFIT